MIIMGPAGAYNKFNAVRSYTDAEKTDLSNMVPAMASKQSEDKVELSPKAMELESAKNLLNRTNESNKKGNKALRDDLKCMIIATRIIAGDRVPSKDERFLAKNNPPLYLRAILLRRQKDNPKEYKSILEDEDREKPNTLHLDASTPDFKTVVEAFDKSVVNQTIEIASVPTQSETP